MKTKQKIEEVEREIEKYKEIYSNYEELSPYIRMRAKLQTLKECEKDVKEAVRRLKGEFIKCRDKTDIWADEERWNKFERMFKKEIDKIFGEKLAGEQEK